MFPLSDTIVAGGSAILHVTGGNRVVERVLRKGKSHGSLLRPLAKLVPSPVGRLGSAAMSCLDLLDGDENRDEQRKKSLYLRMKDASTYEHWRAAAAQLDVLQGNDAWKMIDESPEYNYKLVATRIREFDEARLNCDVPTMAHLIRTSLSRGLGDMGDLRMYKHSHIGTKKLIERYIESVQQTLAALLEVSATQGAECPIAQNDLYEQLKLTRQSFGRTALLLSGGGTFGMNHIGVVKTLWESRLLPRVISGASAGSIVCAVLCTKTDLEMPHVLHEFCYGDLEVFGSSSEPEGFLRRVVRLFKTGGMFDISHLKRVMRGLLGDMTFQEAYNRTRRILNIPVSTSSHFEHPRLLNYVTAPNVMIWSAVCTSCSVPLIYRKASLMMKCPRTGVTAPWDPENTWIDGSVDNDLPMLRLAEIFNVNHFIVSQVNPHVVPFLAKEDEIMPFDAQQSTAFSAGSRWISAATDVARMEMVHRLEVLKTDFGLGQSPLSKIISVLVQQYSGDINIFPSISFADFPRVLTNPTTAFMLNCLLTGQKATWPKMSRIQNHVAIELAIDDTLQQLRARIEFDHRKPARQSSEDSNLNHLRRSRSVYRMSRTRLAQDELHTLFRMSAPSSPTTTRAALHMPALLPRSPTAPPLRQRKPAASPSPTQRTDSILPPPPTTLLSDSSSDPAYDAGLDTDSPPLSPGVQSSPTILASPSPPTSPSPPLAISTANTNMNAFRPSLRSASAPSTPMSQIPPPSGSRAEAFLELRMTPVKGMSREEAVYKRLFHGAGTSTKRGTEDNETG